MNGQEMWDSAIKEVEERMKIENEMKRLEPILNKIKSEFFHNDLDIAAFMYLQLSNKYYDLKEKVIK